LSCGVNIVRWSRGERTLSRTERVHFFDGAHERFTVFNFVTRKLAVPAHGGPLSLKVVLRGAERYEFGGRRLTLRPGEAMFVNAGESYSSAVSGGETESLSIFVPPNEASAAAHACADECALLDDAAPGAVRELAQAPFRVTADLDVVLRSLRHARGEDALDCVRAATSLALMLHARAAPATALRDIKRRAVRDEVLTRLLRARDYLHDRRGRDVPLEALAAVACMSRYHFLRRFNEAFGQTPAAMAKGLRLAAARDALARGGERAHAARIAGYRSYDALARALRQSAGGGGGAGSAT